MLYSESDLNREHTETEELDLGRSAFRRDYGRLLHSPSFRRLQGKTQLFPGHESDFFRNRLTHSLEVAQIAKGIAQKINNTVDDFSKIPIDLDLVEFAGLAHDLGHPPFGHNGEKALDDCMKLYGGFEGNAQTLRILSKIEKKIQKDFEGKMDGCGISEKGDDLRLGLNPTYRALASILKYDAMIPLRRKKGSPLKKGFYASEKHLVERVKENVSPVKYRDFKTIECQIMDIADDIAYSTYDLEDSMKGGFVHPLSLIAKLKEESLVKKLHEKVKKEVSDVTREDVFSAVTDLFDSTAGKTINSYLESKLIASNGFMRTNFCSELIGGFIKKVNIRVLEGEEIKFSKIDVERETKIKIESLKHLNYLITIMSPRLKLVEYRGYGIVKSIFDALDSEDGYLLMPDDVQVMYQRLLDTDSKKRLICDFVSGMTDRYAIEFYGRLNSDGASIFKPIS